MYCTNYSPNVLDSIPIIQRDEIQNNNNFMLFSFSVEISAVFIKKKTTFCSVNFSKYFKNFFIDTIAFA